MGNWVVGVQREANNRQFLQCLPQPGAEGGWECLPLSIFSNPTLLLPTLPSPLQVGAELP